MKTLVSMGVLLITSSLTVAVASQVKPSSAQKQNDTLLKHVPKKQILHVEDAIRHFGHAVMIPTRLPFTVTIASATSHKVSLGPTSMNELNIGFIRQSTKETLTETVDDRRGRVADADAVEIRHGIKAFFTRGQNDRELSWNEDGLFYRLDSVRYDGSTPVLNLTQLRAIANSMK